MAGAKIITIPKWRRIREGPGTGAGNRKLLKRYIARAEALCTDPKTQAAVVTARNAWNLKYPDYVIDPTYPRESQDPTLGNASLANAVKYALKQDSLEEWRSLQPTVIEWFDRLAELHITAFPPVVWDAAFAAGQPIGIKFIGKYFELGPDRLKDKCEQYFPTLREIYEAYARRIASIGSCLPIDANTTAEDMKDFAKFALPLVRASTNTNETFIGLAIYGLTTGGFDRVDIAFRLGLTPRTVKAWFQYPR